MQKDSCISDTSYLARILPTTGNDGGPVVYSYYKGKFIAFDILNNTNDIIYLYSRSDVHSPIDSLLYRAVSIDSVFVSERYVAQAKNGIDENFEVLGDSIIPMHSKRKILLNLSSRSINCEQIKGAFHYGVKDKSGNMLYKSIAFQF